MNPFRSTGPIGERPTLDLVVLILTIVVAVVIIGAVATVSVLEIQDEASSTEDVVAMIDAQIGTITGALLGLIAGQASGRRQGTLVP